ncbi:MAG: hypothetical protein J6Q31_02885 [Alistipes sp.]|nr:hypothetical protein [Alistipes sp.]
MKRGYLLLLSLVTLVACTNNDVAIDKTQKPTEGKIYAAIDNDGVRVQLNSEVQTVWNEGDQITILGPNEYAQYKFDGKTGDRSGTFSNVESFDPIKDKSIKFNAIFPGHGNLNYAATRASNAEMIAKLPSQQKYTKDSYCPKSNIMVGTSNDGSSYVFKNVVSYLRLSLVGQKAVKSIKLRGNNRELLAGEMFVNTDNLNCHLKGDDIGNVKEISLDCGKGVQLSETPVDFHFVVPPINMEKGFIIVVEFTDGTVFSKVHPKMLRMMRNRLYPMAVLNVDPSDDDKYIYIYHSGNTIATPLLYLTADVLSPATVAWGDDNVSILGTDDDVENYVYTDDKPSHTVTVQTSDANILILNSCIGISKIDLTNF